jgi:hypothetical protein
MPGPAKDDDSLIPVQTRFHSQALRPGGVSREQAIGSAERVLDTMQPQFAEWLDRELRLLILAIPAEHGDIKSSDPWLESAYLHARAVRDVGATMGFELLTFAANNLCDIIEVARSGVDCPFDTVENQIQALLVAKREVDHAQIAQRNPAGAGKTPVKGPAQPPKGGAPKKS